MNHLKSLIAALAFLLSSHAFSANWNMTNLHMQFYADHLWLFYQCGDDVYFNHEKRDQRLENDRSLTFSWITHSTMLGMRYCDGFGHSFINAGISKNSPVQTLPLADKMFMFYQTSANSNLIKYKFYTGRPKASPDRNKWSRSTTLTDNRGIPIRTENYSAFESGGELYVAFSSRGNLFIRTPSGEIKKIETQNVVLDSPGMKAVSTVTKTGARSIIEYVGKNSHGESRFSFTVLDMTDFSKGHIDPGNHSPKFFHTPLEVQSMDMVAELNGNIYLQYVKDGKRQRSKLNLENMEPESFDQNERFVTPFTNKESKAYGTVQMPVSCKVNAGCKLINFNYPRHSMWLGGPSSLFHLSYAGKVVVRSLDILPVEHNQMELLGIIEGPPPVPLENVLASFAALPPAFVLNAARGLSRFIRTNINQVLTMTDTESNETAKTKIHSVSAKGQIPLVLPIKMSGMASVKSKTTQAQTTSRTTTVKKTYSNEIQHTSKSGNRLVMKPVGKLIFLKYDITGFQYKFQDENNKVMENGPGLYSLSKTNVRPVIRQYDLIARNLNPEKYQNHIQVGNLESYNNLHRRRVLMNKATELAPGHNYLSFTYNNSLDLATEIDIKTSTTLARSTTDSLNVEGSLGTGFGDLFGAEIKMATEEERTYSVSNTAENGMAINVNMDFVVPAEDESVKFYDFEVYYLQPAKENLQELLEELGDTKDHSRWNSLAFEKIKRDSKPWKITYSVSKIINNESLSDDYKDDLLGEGLSLGSNNENGRWKADKEDLPKTLFGLMEQCQKNKNFAEAFESACQRALKDMQ